MKHLSARLAWHDSGWNGRICQNPKANTYCVGQYSYQRDMIVRDRDLSWEQPHAGQACSQLDRVPPCIHSINAFGPDELDAYTAPPSWFQDGTQIKTSRMAPYTVSIWPYEEMYKDEVLSPPGAPTKYDAAARREAANAFFEEIDEDRSLVFYYVNYSNPFSENDQHFYVVVGAGRVKTVGEELTWIGQSSELEERYGPNVWVRDITSHYPDQGFRLPYHLCMDRPEVLERILFVPENPRNFKYAARHISDDGALGLIERLSEIVGVLQEIGDESENWQARQAWLSSVMAELWQNRGLCPGILRVWDYLGFREVIPYTMEQILDRGERDVKDEIFAFLQGQVDAISGLSLDRSRAKKMRKRWRYLEPDQKVLLRDVLPRFDLDTDQVRCILDHPQQASVYADHAEIANNPYLLSEQYVGADPDDQVTFRQIDHGVFPSPDLGAKPELDPDDWERLRALCVEQLQRADQHAFLPADQVLHGLNHKLSFLPEWKRAQFTERHLEVEEDELRDALTYRRSVGQLFLYLKTVFEDERQVEGVLRELSTRPDIQLRFPVTENHWRSYLYRANSDLAQTYPEDYEQAIVDQIEVCQEVFRRPISVICGPAGTGKTFVVKAIIQAIEKAHGTGTSFQLLAPTGKAADRLRELTGKENACTIHSFLARRGWLNDNFTFRRRGGQVEQSIITYVIDEASMLDLSLLAAFCRAVNWNAVQRLILVGDPNQLPPIGTGKVFADLIDWLKHNMPEHVGELETSVRQLRNRLTGQGTGILRLASLYLRHELEEHKTVGQEAQMDQILRQVQEGGDLDGDLRVLYWQTTDDLEDLLVDTIVADMEQVTGLPFNPKKPYELWQAMMEDDGEQHPEALQVISPYRGELFGIEHINQVFQEHRNNWWLENKGSLGGITYFDKTIQVVNRTRSRPIKAYNTETGKVEWIQIFNGEIGLTKIHAFDNKRWRKRGFHIGRLQVVFSRRQHLWVEYASNSAVEENLELAYAISVHKSQGSEFDRVYFILPKHKQGLLSPELFYTGITRAEVHCTLLVQEDIAPLLTLRRLENSHLAHINSSLFEFRPVPPALQTMSDWYEEGRIHRTLTEEMVRSKSEVIIANMLADRDIPFKYEVPLYAPDGTFYLPDFTISWRGQEWYWEHLGMLRDQKYRNHWDTKRAWYEKHGFADHLITTREAHGFDSRDVLEILELQFGV